MIAAYNPFEIFNLPMIRRLVQHGNHYIVLQRFNWPGIREGNGFMATPYPDLPSVKKHTAQLAKNEGKMLHLGTDIEKITALINDPRYNLFLCTFREENCDQKLLKIYQRNMVSFLGERMPVDSSEKIEIYLAVTFGRLTATVMANGQEREFDMYQMIK